MSSLRRRVADDTLDPPITPSNDPSDDGCDKPLAKRTPGTRRRHAWIFFMGGLFGLVLAAFFARQNEMLDLTVLGDWNLEGILDVLPAGLVKDAQDLQVMLPTPPANTH